MTTIPHATPANAGLLLSFFVFFFLCSGVSAIHYAVANQTTCACEFATFKIHAENLQGQRVHEDLWLQSELYVQPGFVDVLLEPMQSMIYPVYIHAACTTAPGDYPVVLQPSGVTAYVQVKDCQGFSLTVTPQQASCQNDHVTYGVTVENLGNVPRIVSLGTDLNPDAYVLPGSVELSAREKKSLILSVNTNTLPQRLPFRVVARADESVVYQHALVDVQACTGFRASGPTRLSLTAGQSQSFEVRLENHGATRIVNVQAFCPSFIKSNASRLTVGSGQVVAVLLKAQAAPAGVYSCTVSATTEDDGRTFSHTLQIDVQPTAANYTVRPSSVVLEEGVIRRVGFHVENTGRIESASVSFVSNATRVISGPSSLSAAREQELPFVLTPDCTTYPFELTRGGARHLCPASVPGQLRINNQSFSIQVRIVPPTLLFDSKAYADGSGLPGGVRLDVVATNTGNVTDLQLSSVPQARSPATVFVPSGGQAFFSVFLEGNHSSLQLEARTDRGTYRHRADLTAPASGGRPGPTTGLITLAAPVIAFSIAVLLALALLYFLYRRRK